MDGGARRAMITYVALLRAVNVGGTGKLPMEDLRTLCAEAGFSAVRTFIASGNALFRSDGAEAEVRQALEWRLEAYAGRPVGVVVRSARELAEVAGRNPFPDAPAQKVGALFTDQPLPAHPLDGAVGRATEEVRLGERELFVFFPDGMGRTRLRLPAGQSGTMRNMNTVVKLAVSAGGPA